MIGANAIDLEPLIEDCSTKGSPMALSKDYYKNYLVEELKWDEIKYDNDTDFWLHCNTKDDAGKYTSNGRIRMQI